MSKFGTQLVREGLVNPQQLEEALRMQTLYGGRLGSTIVELNFVHVDVMSEFLGRITGFPVATQAMVDEATEEAIELVPAEMAERFDCLPLRKDGRRLHMAMVTPENLAATDALSFKTGLRIVPYVVLELRLHYALEEKYGIVKKEGSVGLRSREEFILKARASSPPPPSAPVDALPELPSLSIPPPTAVPSTPPPVKPTSLPPGWNEATARSTPPRPITAPQPIIPLPRPTVEPLSAGETVEALKVASSRDEIARILLRFCAGFGSTAYLFLVRDGMALGWMGHGGSTDIESVMLPLNAPSVFQEVCESKAPFAGAPPDQVLHRHFYKALRQEPPQAIVLVPVVMRDRAVNLVYLEHGEGEPQATAELLAALAPHAAVAYERIVREAKSQA